MDEEDEGARAVPFLEDDGDEEREDEGGGEDGPSGAHQNSNKRREREPTLHWADTGFAGYMQAKVRKLEEQHRSNQAAQQPLSGVFSGVTIHVNGLTNPSHTVSLMMMRVFGLDCTQRERERKADHIRERFTRLPPPLPRALTTNEKMPRKNKTK